MPVSKHFQFSLGSTPLLSLWAETLALLHRLVTLQEPASVFLTSINTLGPHSFRNDLLPLNFMVMIICQRLSFSISSTYFHVIRISSPTIYFSKNSCQSLGIILGVLTSPYFSNNIEKEVFYLYFTVKATESLRGLVKWLRVLLT